MAMDAIFVDSNKRKRWKMSKVDLMLKTLKRVYRKHVLDDKSIGWDELSDELLNTLCEVMGDGEYVSWLNAAKNKKVFYEQS